MDSYLEIARGVLKSSRQPLSARQILEAAHQLQLVPRELYGQAQHKTLHARLATDILKRRSSSEFYRTAPGRFFLRSFRSDHSIPDSFRREYQAPLRSAQLGRFDVVAFPISALSDLAGPNPIPIAELFTLPWRFVRLYNLRRNHEMVAFRFHLLIFFGGKIFVNNTKHAETNDDLHHRSMIGIEGHIRRGDLSLFSSDGVGLIDAAIRTLLERFDLPSEALSSATDPARWSITQVIVSAQGEDERPDLIAYLAFQCDGVSELIEAIDERTATEWLPVPIMINDVSRFDKWSSLLIRDIELQNRLYLSL